MTIRPSVALAQHREEARRIFIRHGLGNPRVFGSAARGTDLESSDLDVIFDPGPHTTLFDISRAHTQLSQLLQVHVDLVPARQIPLDIRPTLLTESVPL